MKNLDTRYWIELSAITLLLAGLSVVVFTCVLPGLYPPIFPVLFATIVVITIVGQIMLSRQLDKDFRRFNTAFMVYKAVKILILMVFMLVYSLLHRELAVPFLISTFILYLVYMVFESRSLNRQSRRQAQH